MSLRPLSYGNKLIGPANDMATNLLSFNRPKAIDGFAPTTASNFSISVCLAGSYTFF